MATRLSDIYNPLTFVRRAQEAQTRLNAFRASGIAVADPILQAALNGGGNQGDINIYGPLATGEPRYSNDDPTDTNTTHGNISNKTQKWRSAQRNQSWSLMDLARELADSDPIGAITDRVGAFWASDDETRLIQSLLGILADNVANDSGDMLVSVATDGIVPIADAERIDGNVVIDGMQTLGDHKMAVSAMAIHSAIHARLQKQELIQYMRDSSSNIMFETYLGKRLIVDDSLPAVQGVNRITYTSILFGPGAVLTGNGKVENPSELERDPDSGNGAGETKLYSRVNDVFHPNGFSFLSASVAGQSATYAELEVAANWDRIVARKTVPIAFLQTND